MMDRETFQRRVKECGPRITRRQVWKGLGWGVGLIAALVATAAIGEYVPMGRSGDALSVAAFLCLLALALGRVLASQSSPGRLRCPSCGTSLSSPRADKFVLKTGRCGGCGEKILSDTNLDAPAGPARNISCSQLHRYLEARARAGAGVMWPFPIGMLVSLLAMPAAIVLVLLFPSLRGEYLVWVTVAPVGVGFVVSVLLAWRVPKRRVCEGCGRQAQLLGARTGRCVWCGAAISQPPTPEEIRHWRRDVRRARIRSRAVVRRFVVFGVVVSAAFAGASVALVWWVLGLEAAAGETLTFADRVDRLLGRTGVMLALPLMIVLCIALGHRLGRRAQKERKKSVNRDGPDVPPLHIDPRQRTKPPGP
ncbi:MAG TPA: hypothetical protein VM389_07285 [Phycisphaerae bacterium]|nr:hypothetical protein [Phycisphaerae bacterium]